MNMPQHERRWSWPVRGIARGADWNPDQWPREIWLRDIELMSEAGVNLVTLPVFSWPLLEPSEGNFEFDWLEEILDRLHGAGIAADLATGTATPPAWLVRAHPEVLPVDVDGRRLEYGSRQSYCLNSSVFAARTEALATAMAARFGRHPALAMWHISNEYGDHVTRCYCNACAEAFRVWLVDRYGDIDALNAAWGTTMWGQVYGDFGHIEPPRRTMAPANPTHTLDFARFSSDAIAALFARERDVLRRITPDVPVTTNFMTVMTDVDYWGLAPLGDIISFDNYPDPADPRSDELAALNYGVMRSLAERRPWMLLESATSAVSWRPVNVPKAPGLNRVHAFQAVAHGSDAVMYFQWRASRVGAERFHSAIIGHRGEASRTLVETTELWSELTSLDDVAGSRVRASAAILVDWQSRWAMQGPETMPSERMQWLPQMRTYMAALADLGITVDAVHPGADLAAYRLVVAPSQFMISDEAAANLAAFVERGGQLIVGPFSAVVDPLNHVHTGGAPGPLSPLLGVAVEEPWPLVHEAAAVFADGREARVCDWAEFVHAEPGTQILATYRCEGIDGRPAVTRRATGSGAACYVSAMLDSADLLPLLRDAAAASGIPVRGDSNHALEIVTRTDGQRDFTFAVNHGADEVTVHIPEAAIVRIGPSVAAGRVKIPRYGVLVIETRSFEPSLQQIQIVEVTA